MYPSMILHAIKIVDNGKHLHNQFYLVPTQDGLWAAFVTCSTIGTHSWGIKLLAIYPTWLCGSLPKFSLGSKREGNAQRASTGQMTVACPTWGAARSIWLSVVHNRQLPSEKVPHLFTDNKLKMLFGVRTALKHLYQKSIQTLWKGKEQTR